MHTQEVTIQSETYQTTEGVDLFLAWALANPVQFLIENGYRHSDIRCLIKYRIKYEKSAVACMCSLQCGRPLTQEELYLRHGRVIENRKVYTAMDSSYQYFLLAYVPLGVLGVLGEHLGQ